MQPTDRLNDTKLNRCGISITAAVGGSFIKTILFLYSFVNLRYSRISICRNSIECFRLLPPFDI